MFLARSLLEASNREKKKKKRRKKKMPGAVASKCDCHTNKLEKESLVGATKWRIKAQIYES